MGERDAQAPDRLRPAQRGNTDAKLFAPEDCKEMNELQDEASRDAAASGQGGPVGGKAV